MGIKNLMKFIKTYAPSAIRYTKITEYKHKILAIDADLLIHKMIYAVRLNGYDIKNDDIIVTHIHALLLKIIGFKKYDINPIFVFDGSSPAIKDDTMKARKNVQDTLREKYEKATTEKEKEKYYYSKSVITSREFSDCVTLLELFNITIIDALEEADAQIYYLLNQGYAENAVSDDLDLLVFGCSILLKNFTVSTNKYIQEINLDTLKKQTNLDQNQFIDIGILLGCDYCPHIESIGPVTAYKIIKKYESLDNFIINAEHDQKTKLDKYKKKYKKAKQYFLNPPVNKNIEINKNIGLTNNNKSKLILFLKKHKFTQKYIDKIFTKLDESIDYNPQYWIIDSNNDNTTDSSS